MPQGRNGEAVGELAGQDDELLSGIERLILANKDLRRRWRF